MRNFRNHIIYVKTDAYFTVEAAFLIPVVLCLFAFVIYLAFFMYDRCLLTQDSYQMALYESEWKSSEDKDGSSGFSPDKLRYFMLKALNIEGQKKGKNYTAQASASVHTMFGHGMIGLGRADWDLTSESTARVSDPPKAFRTYRRSVRVAEKIAQRVKAGLGEELREEGDGS